MAVVVGIDEAGYGPILGPLVVSAAAFGMPDDQVGGCLWDMLRSSVARTQSGSAGRVVIADSKKLKTADGYARLQRGVLAYLAAANGRTIPANLADLLALLTCDIGNSLAEYPWYGLSWRDHGLCYDAADIATAANALTQDAAKGNVALLGLSTRLLCAGHFNRQVAATRNKAAVSFALVAHLIDAAFRRHGQETLQIVIDRQGGCTHYRPLLQRMFPECRMKVLKENASVSSYHLAEQGRQMRIHFLAKGETRQLPIALASMTSKYVRELFMELLNGHFSRHCPGIKPTAGYYTDGRRFLSDLERYRLRPELAPKALLVRER